MAKNDFNIFYILSAIADTKEDITNHPHFEKEYNIFMINRWLSMHPRGVFAAYFANQIRDISKKDHFYFVRGLVEPSKNGKTYFKFAKSDKKEKYIKIIMDYYNISEENAHELVYILDNNQIKLLEKSFGQMSKR